MTARATPLTCPCLVVLAMLPWRWCWSRSSAQQHKGLSRTWCLSVQVGVHSLPRLGMLLNVQAILHTLKVVECIFLCPLPQTGTSTLKSGIQQLHVLMQGPRIYCMALCPALFNG